jgi:hypothetical protein
VQEAIAALKAGNRARAFTLLRQHLVANPRDANGWLWMSEVAPELRHQIDALQRVLLLAPDHPHAGAIRERLRELNASTRPQPAMLDAPPPAPAKETSPPLAEPAPSLNDIDALLARIRGEISTQNREGGRAGERSPYWSATPSSTGGRNREGQEFIGSTSDSPVPVAAGQGGARQRQRRGASGTRQEEDLFSVAIKPRTTTENRYWQRGATQAAENEAPARQGGPVPRWVWGAILFLLLVLAAIVYVVLSASQTFF